MKICGNRNNDLHILATKAFRYEIPDTKNPDDSPVRGSKSKNGSSITSKLDLKKEKIATTYCIDMLITLD